MVQVPRLELIKNDMSRQKIQLRKMNLEDLPAALQLVESVGWNQTERDLKLFLEGENNIYLVAEIEKQVVGMVASIGYGMDVAWVSMMIVAEAFRGHSISKFLLNTLIQRLKTQGYQTIKLDATPAGRPVYRKLGFKEEYVINRFVHAHWPGLEHTPPKRQARPMINTDLPAVIGLDQAIFGAARVSLINRLFEDSPGYVVEKQNEIQAYVFGRKGRRLFQIGPVGGRCFEDLQLLILLTLTKLTGQAVVLDVLTDKSLLINWLNSLGFVCQRPFHRMYLEINKSPGEPASQYCIAGPEFG